MRRSRRCAGSLSEAQALWYEAERWPQWVDGCARILLREGPWPRAGGQLSWESGPDGRGQVSERVTQWSPASQTAQVQDSALSGVQRVRFDGDSAGVQVTLELVYTLRHRRPGGAVIDWLFIRRALGDSLLRTLDAFARELAAPQESPGRLR